MQTSVKFRDFKELYLRWFSTSHFQTWQIYSFKGDLSSGVDEFSLTYPRERVTYPRGRVVTLFPSILNFQKFALCASENWLPVFIFRAFLDFRLSRSRNISSCLDWETHQRHFWMKNFHLKAIMQVKIFTVIQTFRSIDEILMC